MKIVQAVRHLALHYVDACKEYMDEDTYEDVKVVIENTKDKKLISKLKRHMSPVAELLSMEHIQPQDLRNAKIITGEKDPTQQEIDMMLMHAKMCYSVIDAVSQMDDNTIAQIESISDLMHTKLQEQTENLSSENTSPEELFKLLAGSMEGALAGPELGAMEGGGEIADLVQKNLPMMMKAITSANQPTMNKTDLLSKFSEINGKI